MNKIRDDIADIVCNELVEETKNIMLETTNDTVYESYYPAMYERRYEAGGLLSEENISVEKKLSGNSMEIELENKTTGRTPTGKGTYRNNGVEIANMIESGEYIWGDVGPRPFLADTRRAIKKQDLVKKVVRKNLKAKGYKVIG